MGAETVVRAFALLESSEWKMEKVTASNDTIQTCSKSIGKVYKLTGKVNYPPGKLLMEFFHNIDDIPKWNPTLLESRVIKVGYLNIVYVLIVLINMILINIIFNFIYFFRKSTPAVIFRTMFPLLEVVAWSKVAIL